MSGIINKLADIWESIKSLGNTLTYNIGLFFAGLFEYLDPTNEKFILKTLLEFFVTLLDYLNPFSENFILYIFFNWLVDLLELIFVPDVELLQTRFDYMLESISSQFGINFDSLQQLSNSITEKPLTDINANYTLFGVGVLNLKFFDTTYLIQGIERFRPLIRGFVVFLLILYNYYQALSFIGQDPRIASHDIKEGNNFLKGKEK